METLLNRNAVIKSTSLGFEDHGIMSASITVEFNDGMISFGGYALGGAATDSFVQGVLKAVGVETWEALVGKHVRCQFDGGGFGARMIAIGDIIKPNFFNAKTWSETYNKSKS